MKRSGERECRIDVFWDQWTAADWRATLIDSGTGARYEVVSEEELAVALQKIRAGRETEPVDAKEVAAAAPRARRIRRERLPAPP